MCLYGIFGVDLFSYEPVFQWVVLHIHMYILNETMFTFVRVQMEHGTHEWFTYTWNHHKFDQLSLSIKIYKNCFFPWHLFVLYIRYVVAICTMDGVTKVDYIPKGRPATFGWFVENPTTKVENASFVQNVHSDA